MSIIETLYNIAFPKNSKGGVPTKDLESLAIHNPYDYDTVLAVYNILDKDINETEKCLIFSRWLHFDPIWMAERTKSTIIDVVVDSYNRADIERLKKVSNIDIGFPHVDTIGFWLNYLTLREEDLIK